MQHIARSFVSWFGDRWHRRIPWTRLFWRDMLLHGTLLNAIFSLLGLILIASRWPDWIAYCVLYGLVPYNLFVLTALSRSLTHAPLLASTLCQISGMAWFSLFLVV